MISLVFRPCLQSEKNHFRRKWFRPRWTHFAFCLLAGFWLLLFQVNIFSHFQWNSRSSSSNLFKFKNKPEYDSVSTPSSAKSVQKIFLFGYFRGGSSFVGDLLQQGMKTFYLYEPFHHRKGNLEKVKNEALLNETGYLWDILFECDYRKATTYLKWLSGGPDAGEFLANWNQPLWEKCRSSPANCGNLELNRHICAQSSRRLTKVNRLRFEQAVLTLKNQWSKLRTTRLLGDKPLWLLLLVRDPRAIFASLQPLKFCPDRCQHPKYICGKMRADLDAFDRFWNELHSEKFQDDDTTQFKSEGKVEFVPAEHRKLFLNQNYFRRNWTVWNVLEDKDDFYKQRNELISSDKNATANSHLSKSYPTERLNVHKIKKTEFLVQKNSILRQKSNYVTAYRRRKRFMKVHQQGDPNSKLNDFVYKEEDASSASFWLRQSVRLGMLRFEQLALQPVSMSRALFHRLGLAFNSQVQQFLEAHTGYSEQQLAMQNDWKSLFLVRFFQEFFRQVGEKDPYSTVRKSSEIPSRWLHALPWNKVQEVQEECAEVMEMMGYRKIAKEQFFRLRQKTKPSPEIMKELMIS